MAKTTLSKEMQSEYRRAVQRVNKQLYRLEKAYAGKPDQLQATAYSGIMRDIKKEFGDQKRFGKGMPKNMNEFRKRMNIINRFYEKPSATLSGMKNVYSKRAATLSKKLNTKLTTEDLKNFFDSGLWKALSDRFGSGKAMRYWKTIEKQKQRVVDQLNAGKKVTFRGALAKDINQMGLDSMLRDYLEGRE